MKTYRVFFKDEPDGIFWFVEATSMKDAIEQISEVNNLDKNLLSAQ